MPIPDLAAGEALVRIRCATICASDLHSRFGRRPVPAPSILGHEMVGEIADTGPEGVCDYRGVRLARGDRVTWSMVWSCGDCFYCQRGLRPKCEHLAKFGHEELGSARPLFGSMAEYCWLPRGTAIFRVPQPLPDLVACPASCATATVAAMFRTAGIVEGQTVVVHGAGMLGLAACAMAASLGAENIVAVEPDPERREIALRFGASVALDSAFSPEEIQTRIKSLTAGRGADAAFELSGHPDSIELGIGLLRPGGRLLLAGATFPARPVRLDAQQLVRRMIQVSGVYNYAPEDLETALRFLAGASNRYPFEKLVAKTFPLAEADAAFAFAERERPLRAALIP